MDSSQFTTDRKLMVWFYRAARDYPNIYISALLMHCGVSEGVIIVPEDLPGKHLLKDVSRLLEREVKFIEGEVKDSPWLRKKAKEKEQREKEIQRIRENPAVQMILGIFPTLSITK